MAPVLLPADQCPALALTRRESPGCAKPPHARLIAQRSGLITRHGEDVCGPHGWVEAHVVGLAPREDLAVEFIGSGEPLVPVHSKRGHIKPHRGYPGLVRVKIHYNEDGVCGGPVLSLIQIS